MKEGVKPIFLFSCRCKLLKLAFTSLQTRGPLNMGCGASSAVLVSTAVSVAGGVLRYRFVRGDPRADEIAACAGSALVADGASQGSGKLEGKEKSTQQGGHYRRKYGHHDAEDAASHARRRHAYGASHNLPSLERPVKHASHEAAHDSRDALREALQHAEKRHPLHRPWSAHGQCSHSVLRHHGKARPPPAATTAQAKTGASKAGAQTFSRTRSADPHAVKPHHDHTEHHPRSLHRDMAAVGDEEHPHHDAALERSVSRLLHRRLRHASYATQSPCHSRCVSACVSALHYTMQAWYNHALGLRHASVYAIALSFAQTLKALTHVLTHARAPTQPTP